MQSLRQPFGDGRSQRDILQASARTTATSASISVSRGFDTGAALTGISSSADQNPSWRRAPSTRSRVESDLIGNA